MLLIYYFKSQIDYQLILYFLKQNSILLTNNFSNVFEKHSAKEMENHDFIHFYLMIYKLISLRHFLLLGKFPFAKTTYYFCT